jgi:uncharacterized delta-60 repeat protein
MTRFRKTAVGVAIATLLVALASPAVAVSGQVDNTFGSTANGMLLFHYGHEDGIRKVLRQTDGKLVTVGISDANLVMTRRSANGTLDSTFANHGVLLRKSPLASAAMQPDNKVIVTGPANAAPGFFVTRFRTDGTVDPSFHFAHPAVNVAVRAIAVGPGGTVVLAGNAGSSLAVVRYTSTGALDTTFSGDGVALASVGSNPIIDDVVAQANGAVVVSGQASGGLLLRRFDTNGVLDGTFAPHVNANTPIAGIAFVQQGTGYVVIGPHLGDDSIALARYGPTGTLDPAFGSAGATKVIVGTQTDGTDLIVDGAGRLIVVADSGMTDDPVDAPESNVTLFRFSATGTLDTSFGCNGSVVNNWRGGRDGFAWYIGSGSSAVLSGTDIVVGGFATTDPSIESDALLLAYVNEGGTSRGYSLVTDQSTTAFGGAPACKYPSFIDRGPTSSLTVGGANLRGGRGFWTVSANGALVTYGSAHFYGSTSHVHLAQPVVGMAGAPDGHGYWLVARDGGVFSFGSAKFYGSTGNIRLTQPIVGMTAAPDGHGYWLVASDGGVFSFGSARFFGSMGAKHLNAPVVGMASSIDGRGYWLVASDGGIFSFGDAHFAGSTGAIHLAQPVVGMAADPDGTGYWLAARDGGVFAFGAPFLGSTGAFPPQFASQATVGIFATP